MEKVKYKRLLDEVFGLMRGEALEAALCEKRTSARVDAVQDLMRGSVERSSIGKFNGIPYYFGGKIYEPMTWDEFGNLVYDLMRRCRLPNGDYSRVEGVLKVCRRVVSGKALRPDNAVVVFNNRVLDMSSGESYPFSRRFVQTSSVPYDYNPDDHVFLWRQFLDEVLPDRSMQCVLQEFLGSIFVDRSVAKLETMLVLLGSGSNGKSVVFETITGLLGRENVSNFGIGALTSGGERKKNIAFINGKRLNYCSEIQALELGRDSDALKALVSGEPTEARPIYGDNFTAYNIPLLMANANRMPNLVDWSYGMRRRICIIPFEVEIPKARQQKSLAKDLAAEYPAIFNWVMEGRERFIRSGYKFTECGELEKVMDEYQSESNTVMKFMYQMDYRCRYEDVADLEPKWVKSSLLYRRYVRWCADNGEEAENATRFGRILSEAGYRKKRTPQGQSYGLFGKPKMIELEYRRKVGYKQLTAKPYYRDGKRWAHSIEGLAKCLSVSLYVVDRAVRGGLLEGFYHREGRARVFDLDACEAKLKEAGVIGRKGKELAADRRKRATSRVMRKTFNARMRNMGLPFRKYLDGNQGTGCIHVPDDWVYSEENALAAIKATGDKKWDVLVRAGAIGNH